VLSPDSVSGAARVGHVALIEDEVPFILIHPHAGVPKRYPFFGLKKPVKSCKQSFSIDVSALLYRYHLFWAILKISLEAKPKICYTTFCNYFLCSVVVL